MEDACVVAEEGPARDEDHRDEAGNQHGVHQGIAQITTLLEKWRMGGGFGFRDMAAQGGDDE